MNLPGKNERKAQIEGADVDAREQIERYAKSSYEIYILLTKMFQKNKSQYPLILKTSNVRRSDSLGPRLCEN